MKKEKKGKEDRNELILLLSVPPSGMLEEENAKTPRRIGKLRLTALGASVTAVVSALRYLDEESIQFGEFIIRKNKNLYFTDSGRRYLIMKEGSLKGEVTLKINGIDVFLPKQNNLLVIYKSNGIASRSAIEEGKFHNRFIFHPFNPIESYYCEIDKKTYIRVKYGCYGKEMYKEATTLASIIYGLSTILYPKAKKKLLYAHLNKFNVVGLYNNGEDLEMLVIVSEKSNEMEEKKIFFRKLKEYLKSINISIF